MSATVNVFVGQCWKRQSVYCVSYTTDYRWVTAIDDLDGDRLVHFVTGEPELASRMTTDRGYSPQP